MTSLFRILGNGARCVPHPGQIEATALHFSAPKTAFLQGNLWRTVQTNITRCFSCRKSVIFRASNTHWLAENKKLSVNWTVRTFAHFSKRTRNIRSSPWALCGQRIFHTGNHLKCSKEAVVNKSKKPKISEVKRLLSLAKTERWTLYGAICLLCVSSAVTMALPFGIGRIIDIIYTDSARGEDMVARLRHFCQLLLVVFLVGGAATFGRVYLMTSAGNRIIKRLRENVFSSIVRQEMAFFDKNRTGELINRLSADTSLVGSSVTQNLSDGLRSTAQALGGVSMMVYMSPKLAGIALLIVPPVILLSRLYGRYMRGITRQVQDALAASTQVAEERVGNIRTVRALAGEQREEALYQDKVEHVLQLGQREAVARAGFWAFTGMSGNLMILAVMYQGGLLMHSSLISVGELSSFLLYAAFVGASVSGLTSFYSELMKGLGASTRLFELQARQPAIPLHAGLVPPSPLLGDVEFRGVTFNYPARPDASVLSELTLHVPRGQVLAVVGASGSGKSTLAWLLLRLYDPLGGAVYVDGRNVREYSPHWLRQQIGIVAQEPVLFSCSIADNIAYGAEEPSTVSRDAIVEAARQANALGFVESFPRGFDTLVGERGVMLSGGQKQRIAIARAIIKNPKILILDEATSALDAESEHLVQAALERLMASRTVLTIAHRLSTVRRAHTIAVLEAGGVAEQGSYTELMADPAGLFRRLVEKQTITAS